MQYSIREVARAVGAECAGDDSIVVHGLAEPRAALPGELAIALEPEFARELKKGSARAAIFSWGQDWSEYRVEAALLTRNPRRSFMSLTRLFAPGLNPRVGVHPAAHVAATARVGAESSVGPFSVIEEGVAIGEGCAIADSVSIGRGTRVGRGCVIHPGVRIGWGISIGDRFVAHANAVIGCDGFSYLTEDGSDESVTGRRKVEIAKIESLGSVRIGDDVEIGACTVIDRGTISETVIGAGTKIDNQVHVAHNVRIGQDCFICGQVGIAGSARIGDRVSLAGMTGVSDHVSVGDDVVAAGAAKIYSNVPNSRRVMGAPAIQMEKNIELYKCIRRLPKLFETVSELERKASRKA